MNPINFPGAKEIGKPENVRDEDCFSMPAMPVDYSYTGEDGKQYESRMSIYLGTLGVMEYFSLNEQIYRTIDYPPSNVNPTSGTRWCLNMKTLKAEYKLCREKVEKVSRETELSE